jgi:hypothetical protein
MARSGRVFDRVRGRRRSWAATTVSLVVTAALAPGPAAGGSNDADHKLRPGEAAFWAGENVDLAQVRDPDLCGTAGRQATSGDSRSLACGGDVLAACGAAPVSSATPRPEVPGGLRPPQRSGAPQDREPDTP